MKWGRGYGVEYANKLYSMVRRHTARPLRFICFTEDTSGLDPAIEALPLPSIRLPESWQWRPWRKISLWQRDLFGLSGDMLVLDLDVVVTGSIDAFFDFEPERTFCVIENWTQMGEGIGNTSVFRFRVGAHPEVFDTLQREPDVIRARYGNEQTLASRLVPGLRFWPAEWCVSFKHELLAPWPLSLVKPALLPPDARVVVFMGRPKPPEATAGRWPVRWYKGGTKRARPTPWIAEHWQ